MYSIHIGDEDSQSSKNEKQKYVRCNSKKSPVVSAMPNGGISTPLPCFV